MPTSERGDSRNPKKSAYSVERYDSSWEREYMKRLDKRSHRSQVDQEPRHRDSIRHGIGQRAWLSPGFPSRTRGSYQGAA